MLFFGGGLVGQEIFVGGIPAILATSFVAIVRLNLPEGYPPTAMRALDFEARGPSILPRLSHCQGDGERGRYASLIIGAFLRIRA